MVIQQASGHSLADLLEHAEHPRGSSKMLLYAMGGAVMLHLLAAYYVYTQRFTELSAPQEETIRNRSGREMARPEKPKPKPTGQRVEEVCPRSCAASTRAQVPTDQIIEIKADPAPQEKIVRPRSPARPGTTPPTGWSSSTPPKGPPEIGRAGLADAAYRGAADVGLSAARGHHGQGRPGGPELRGDGDRRGHRLLRGLARRPTATASAPPRSS